MKNSKINLVVCGLFFAALLTMISCSKEKTIATDELTLEQSDFQFSETNAILSTNVAVENGILIFEKLDDFRSSVLALNRMNVQELSSWQQNLGFKSMQQIFTDIVVSEFEHAGKSHSELYNEKIQSGLIVNDEITGLYKLDLFNPAYAPVLNEQGLVMVNGVLYHFAAAALKAWENADLNQVEKLLNTEQSTDDIQVLPIQYNEVNLRNTSSWTDECQSLSDDSELYLNGFFLSEPPSNPEVIFVDYSISVNVLVRDENGEMDFDPQAQIQFKGKSHTDFPVSNGENNYVKSIRSTYLQSNAGGNYTFIPDAAGERQTSAPWYFTGPASLVQNQWWAYAKTSSGDEHQCTIGH